MKKPLTTEQKKGYYSGFDTFGELFSYLKKTIRLEKKYPHLPKVSLN